MSQEFDESDPWRSQHDLLCEVALRFDGYKYATESGFDGIALGRQMIDDNNPYLGTDEQAMSALFHLQRYICKWGGEQEPLDGAVWKTVRALLIRLAFTPIPESWICRPDPWPQRSSDALSAAIERLRQVDAHLTQRDVASP